MKNLLGAVVMLAVAGACSAGEQQFAFALPEEEGRISLGVFDAKGGLVRTLAVGAEVEDFKIGLNGLLAAWDGRKDDGSDAPSGTYYVRGFVVGDLITTEGVAYHFNDWVEGDDSPRFRRIENFRLLPDGSLVVVAARTHSAGPVVFRYRPEHGFLWAQTMERAGSSLIGTVPPRVGTGSSTSVPFLATGAARLPVTLGASDGSEGLPPAFGARRPLAANDRWVAVERDAGLFLLSAETGQRVSSTPSGRSGQPVCLALGEDTLWVGAWGGVTELKMPGFTDPKMGAAPVTFTALAKLPETLLGGTEVAPGIWRHDGTDWKKMDLPLTVASVSAGKAGRFWVVGKDPSTDVVQVGEFNLDGEFLASYRGDLTPVVVSVAGERVAVLEEDATRQRLILLERTTEAAGQPWEIVFEKNIQRSDRFVVNAAGPVAAGAGEAVSHQGKLVLKNPSLDPSAREMDVRLAAESGGLWLTSGDGLKILQIAGPESDVVRMALRKNGSTLAVYVGDGAVVEEFAIKGLETHLVPLDAGRIDLP